MEEIKALLKKKMKSGDKLEKGDKEAMQGAIGGLRKMAAEMLGEDMEGRLQSLKKVTVAAKDKEGLEEGLEKAKEIVEASDEEDHEDEKFSPSGESDEESADEIEKAILKLQEKLAKKRAE